MGFRWSFGRKMQNFYGRLADFCYICVPFTGDGMVPVVMIDLLDL